jgi:hypothetical protein
MVATVDTEFAIGIWISPRLDVFHMGAIDSYRDIVFRLAGNCASMTSDALSVINCETEIDHILNPQLSLLPRSGRETLLDGPDR